MDGLTREPQGVLRTESASTEWTDEKHRLYLKSMETSFIDQLYNSMDLLGWSSQQDMPNPEAIRHHDVRTPPGELKVLRDGRWVKINFHKSLPQPSTSTESRVYLKSPWIQHFRSSRKSGVATSLGEQQVPSMLSVAYMSCYSSPKIGAASCSKHPHSSQSNSRHHHVVDDNAEVSDQNFVDEDNERENATNHSSSKRKKITSKASRSDQVVPYGKLPLTQE